VRSLFLCIRSGRSPRDRVKQRQAGGNAPLPGGYLLGITIRQFGTDSSSGVEKVGDPSVFATGNVSKAVPFRRVNRYGPRIVPIRHLAAEQQRLAGSECGGDVWCVAVARADHDCFAER
jgi:hypothetical protein